MVKWNNFDTLSSYEEMTKLEKVNLQEVMTGENGANRVKKYSVPMAEGLVYNYAAKQVDDTVLEVLSKVAAEAQLVEKFAELKEYETITDISNIGFFTFSLNIFKFS